jgi:Lipase (class 3)
LILSPSLLSTHTFRQHSLGAGAASIACIEFNENHSESIEAHCIGFGCPALLNSELSERWKKNITTVVNDSDMIPRMSGATVANLVVDLLEFDYTVYAMDDVREVRVRSAFAFISSCFHLFTPYINLPL